VSAEATRAESSRGVTLIEAIVAAVILTAILTTAIKSTTDQTAATEAVRSSLLVRAELAEQKVLVELEEGLIDSPPATGDSLAWQVPIDPDGDGSFLDAEGAIQWGMVRGGVATSGARATVRFAGDRVLDEKLLAFDLNGDRDKKDLFDQGHLERVGPDGAIDELTGSWILQPVGNHGGDLDGDGVGDPIFALRDVSDPIFGRAPTGAKTIATVDLTVAVRLTRANWIASRMRRSVLCQNHSN